MRSLTLPFLVVSSTLLAGCSSSIFGVWLFEIPSATVDDEQCTEDVTHNFTDAEVIDDATSDYSSETTTTRSGSLVLASIEQTAGDGALLVIQDEAYPGSETGDGVWTFSWTGTQLTDQVDEHTQGYSYSWIGDTQLAETFTLTMGDGTLNGTFLLDALDDDSYTETDTWGKELSKIIGGEGQIPAHLFLTVGTPKGDFPASNRFDASECDADSCQLDVVTTCATELAFTGTLTDYAPGEDYDAVEDAGQNPGL